APPAARGWRPRRRPRPRGQRSAGRQRSKGRGAPSASAGLGGRAGMLGPLRGACAPVALLLAAAGAAGQGYDCHTGQPQAWPQAQKDVCCIILGVGCAYVKPTGPTTTLPGTTVTIYDCTIGTENWDVHQQNWCCEHWNKGCSGSPLGKNDSQSEGQEAGSEKRLYDCNKDLEQFSTKWSQTKQDWCCAHWGKGCSSTVDLVQDGASQFECEEGLMNWHNGWSNAKKVCTRQPFWRNAPAQGAQLYIGIVRINHAFL
ncbi:unnamed protein product, partial [Prorocentrum cordatum]